MIRWFYSVFCVSSFQLLNFSLLLMIDGATSQESLQGLKEALKGDICTSNAQISDS